MPEIVRATGGSRSAHPRRCGFLAAVTSALVLGPSPAHAELFGELSGLHHFDPYFDAFAELSRSDIVALALTLGVLLFAVVSAITLVRTRVRAAAADTAFRDKIMALTAERDRCNALLMSEPQILVSWAAADNEPDILGDTTLVTNASLPQRVLAFGSWLEPDKAQAMEHAVDALRADGESFAMQLMTLAGRTVEADGRAIGGRAVLRLRDASGLKRQLAELGARHESG